MKFLLVLCSLLFTTLQTVGQTSRVVDPIQYQNWESDSVYLEAKSNIHNLDNSPQIRLEWVELALNRARTESNNEQASDFVAEGAVVYTELGMNQEALEFALEALEYSRLTSTLKDDVWSLIRLADIHSILHNPAQGILDSHLALQLALEMEGYIEIGWSYNELGEIYRRTARFDSATHYYEKGLEAFEVIDYSLGIQYCHQNLGLTYTAMGEFEMALEEFSTDAMDSIDLDVLYYLEQGEAMVEIIAGKYSLDSAISFGKEMISIAERDNYPTWERKFKGRLAELLRSQNEYEKAWQYHMEADSLEEIHTGERIRLQTSVTDHQYRMQLLQAEHDLLTQQNQNRTLFWISALLVVGLILVVALVQVTKNKRIRKINGQLSHQNNHLDELIKEKDIWINLMAHDLKAPLVSINGLIEMLKDEDLDPSIREKVLDNITKSSNKGTELISQLLEISRLETSEVKADIQATNLNELVRGTKNVFGPAAEKKGIVLSAQVPGAPVEVGTDPVHVRQILENFVSNAIKFSPGGKEVQLILEASANRVNIHVIDQGPGMSEDDQQNLFQKFKKLSAQPTGGESSTGLGLSIVKQLADRIDAEILVKSELGKGTTFTLSLP